jgi:hypothetical protein
MTEVEAARNIAAVQLERVRMQMAENIRPLHYALAVVNHAVSALGAQMSLSLGCAVFGRDFADVVFAPPGEPHMVILDQSKMTVTGTRIFEATLDVEVLARLEADPAARQIWVECWLSLQPQLQAIESIVMTKAHLQEPVQLTDLEPIYRGSLSLGREWQNVYLSAGTMQVLMVVWLRQWCDPHANSRSLRLRLYFVMWLTGSRRRESVRARWSREDYSQLQPTAPAVALPAVFLVMMPGKSCGAREAELQGASSVHAGGYMAVVQRKFEEIAQDDT